MPKTYPIDNPYRGSEVSGQYVRVGLVDLAYLRSKCTCLTGETDKILSTLFHEFIQSLRTYESIHGPVDDAWCTDHATFDLLRKLIQRPTLGQSLGQSGSRDESGGVSELRETVRDAEVVRPDTQSGDTEGKRRVDDRKEKDRDKVQCRTSDGVAGKTLRIPGLDIDLYGVGE